MYRPSISRAGSSPLLAVFPGVLILLSCRGYSLAEEIPSAVKIRRYAIGPLAIKEFQGNGSDRQGRTAFTATRIFCSYKFELKFRGQHAIASLESFDAIAGFLPSESWWSDSDNLVLLDHEQGHFDIAEIQARKVNLSFANMAARGRTITAAGDSADSATDKLKKMINALIDEADKERDAANLEYDRVTRHGLHGQIQAERRRIQRLTLESLEKELKIAKNGRRRPRD